MSDTVIVLKGDSSQLVSELKQSGKAMDGAKADAKKLTDQLKDVGDAADKAAGDLVNKLGGTRVLKAIGAAAIGFAAVTKGVDMFLASSEKLFASYGEEGEKVFSDLNKQLDRAAGGLARAILGTDDLYDAAGRYYSIMLLVNDVVDASVDAFLNLFNIMAKIPGTQANLFVNSDTFKAMKATAEEYSARLRDNKKAQDDLTAAHERAKQPAKVLLETVEDMEVAYAKLAGRSVDLQAQERAAALAAIKGKMAQIELNAILQNQADNISGAGGPGTLTDKQIEDLTKLQKLYDDVAQTKAAATSTPTGGGGGGGRSRADADADAAKRELEYQQRIAELRRKARIEALTSGVSLPVIEYPVPTFGSAGLRQQIDDAMREGSVIFNSMTAGALKDTLEKALKSDLSFLELFPAGDEILRQSRQYLEKVREAFFVAGVEGYNVASESVMGFLDSIPKEQQEGWRLGQRMIRQAKLAAEIAAEGINKEALDKLFATTAQPLPDNLALDDDPEIDRLKRRAMAMTAVMGRYYSWREMRDMETNKILDDVDAESLDKRTKNIEQYMVAYGQSIAAQIVAGDSASEIMEATAKKAMANIISYIGDEAMAKGAVMAAAGNPMAIAMFAAGTAAYATAAYLGSTAKKANATTPASSSGGGGPSNSYYNLRVDATFADGESIARRFAEMQKAASQRGLIPAYSN
jgi:hypothetical protein